MGRDVYFLMLSIQPCPLPTKNGLGEAVMTCDMPEQFKLPFFDSCQKRFLRTHTEVDLVPHAVVGLALQVGYVEKFHQALGFESLDPSFFFKVSKLGPRFTAIEEDGGDKRFVQLELACEDNGAAPPDPV